MADLVELVWSVGPSVVETIFDAGLRRATVQQYRASYEQAVANYRQIVLAAFQEVEDNMVSLRVLPQEIEKQDGAVESARRSLKEATARYSGGRAQQMIATVQLIKALGGGWDASRLPSAKSVESNPARSPDSRATGDRR